MFFLHLSDLHLGKLLNDFSLLEDQSYILDAVTSLIKERSVSHLLLSGDIFDRSIPSIEALELFESFLKRLHELEVTVFLISGNHDGAERLTFGSDFLSRSRIHMQGRFSPQLKPIIEDDEYGPVAFWLLPYFKASTIRRYYPEEEIHSLNDAMEVVLRHLPLDFTMRNVLLTHQFISGASRSESEDTLMIGGSDEISADLFDDFDYVALGHLHRAQSIKRDSLRYSGTLLKYHVSESLHDKSLTLVTLKEKGLVEIETVALRPLRDVIVLEGRYDDLVQQDFLTSQNQENYFAISLTDEEDVPNALGRLRYFYPRLLQLSYNNTRTRSTGLIQEQALQERLSPEDLFSLLFREQNGRELNAEERLLLEALLFNKEEQ